MDTASYKTGILLAYQLLNTLYTGNADSNDTNNTQTTEDEARVLLGWCIANHEALSTEPEFSGLQSRLVQMIERLNADETVSAREYNTLRPLLADALKSWLKNMKPRLYLQSGLPAPETFSVRKDVPAAVTDNYGTIPETSDNLIQILLAGDIAGVNNPEQTAGKIDAIISTKELSDRARYCFPTDIFDYDRLYLSGKLRSLTSSRNDVSIVLGGSSYAMVGLKENLMPRSAINLAVNAQDPFFSFLSVRTAKKYCSKIDTAVIAGGYYFWHTDMSDNPSDYYKSVLFKTNYPIFNKLHNYKGGPPPAKQAPSDPFMDRFFDLRRISEKKDNKISARLAALEYFNSELNIRPKTGMLQFMFREQSDEVNENAARARATAHNGNYNLTHLEENMRLLSEFSAQMNKKRVKIVLLIPPVTKFYRKFSAPELKESLYEMIQPVKDEHGLTFVDLFDSTEFDDSDFQDYDHLNEQGAEKMSKLISRYI